MVLVLSFCILTKNAFSVHVTGFCNDNRYAYYILGKDVYCKEINTDRLIWKKNLNADTLINYNLLQAMKHDLILKKDSLVSAAGKAIKSYKVLNISINDKKIFIGIQFRTVIAVESKTRYAILEFDSTLKYKNLYHFVLRTPFKYFSMPPAIPLNFIDTNTIVLPVYYDTSLCLYTFTLDRKIKKAIPETKVLSIAPVIKRIDIELVTTTILTPVIYSVRNSDNLYYQYPYPIIKSKNGQGVDPYLLKLGIDSINRSSKERPNNYFVGELPISLNFSQHKVYLLSAVKSKDTLYILSKHKQQGLVLIKYDIKIGASISKGIRDVPEEAVFLLTEDRILILNINEERHQLTSRYLWTCFDSKQ